MTWQLCHFARFPAIRRCLIATGVLLATSSHQASAGTRDPQTAKTSSLESHFAAAQEAQKNQDYIAAEREYQAVLSIKPDFPEVHMNLGLLYQLQGRITQAMTQFRSALKLKPDLTGANFFLGVDYCKLGEGTKAIPYLKAAARVEPQRPDIWSWLATALEMAGRTQAEIQTIQQALLLHPNNVDLLYLLGHAYERLANEEIANLNRAAGSFPRAEQLLGENYSASAEWPLAVLHFQNALASSPTQLGLHAELGEVFLRTGRFKRAAQEFDEELALDPLSVRVLVRQGELALIRGEIDLALRKWMSAISVDEELAERVLGIKETGFGDAALELLPDSTREKVLYFRSKLNSRDDPAAHFALAFLAAQRGDSEEASRETALVASMLKRAPRLKTCSMESVQQALKQRKFSRIKSCARSVLTPRATPQFRIHLADAMLQVGEYPAALSALAFLPESERHSADLAFLRARCYEKLATAAYLRLHQSDANSYRMRQLMGDLHAAKDEDNAAIEEYRAAIAQKPELPNLHYSVGHLLWKSSKVSGAREELEAELKLNPHHAGALRDLGGTYLLENQPEKALRYLTDALAANRALPGIHRDLGTAYSELDQYEKAKAEFKLALSDDRDGSIHYKLARMYRALGEKDLAAREIALFEAMNEESHAKLEKQRARLAEIEGSVQDE
jgi:tetratricopeptide (TPR) repeat protein